MKYVTLESVRHPEYLYSLSDWQLWRYTYEGGDTFVNTYLKKFTKRETQPDFDDRKSITPIPTFAKSAVNDIRNAIYQRMSDVIRKGGSSKYQAAVEGTIGGVDNHGTGMNAFIGFEVLTELLVMGKVGVYVDNPFITGNTLAATRDIKPYLYAYPIEDILSWTLSDPGSDSEFKAILLRDRVIDYASPLNFGIELGITLPQGEIERYRLMYINPNTGLVNIQFFNANSQPIDPISNLPTTDGPIELELTKIPFILLDIKGSLLKDVCKHQIALLNLCSSDVAYALKANFPFYTEQVDGKSVGAHLKAGLNSDNTASAGGQGGKQNEIEIGVTQGRTYASGLDRPEFIHPSPEPLEASIKLQEKLEDDIRKLVNLAVANKTGRPISGESKVMDNQGLEAGLSFIGLILETGERKIAEFWATYEQKEPSKRILPVIKYPNRYSLKDDMERISEADKLSELMTKIPGRKIKRELAKLIVATLLAGKVSVDELETINKEIEKANYTTSDPEIIIKSVEAGLVGEKTASTALGFNTDEYLIARDDHMARIERIAESQAKQNEATPGARGIEDLATNANEGKLEKDVSKDTTLKDTTKKPIRGEEK